MLLKSIVILISKIYMLADAIIAVFYILEEFQDQFVKNIPFNVFYNILNYILNDIIELNFRLTTFYNYIIELLELYKVLKEDI